MNLAVAGQRQSSFLAITGPICQEDTGNLNMDTLNNRASKYMRHSLMGLRGEIDKSTITAGDFNALLSIIERRRRQKISEAI